MTHESKPWFALHVDDFLGSETVTVCSNRALGAYVKLMCYQWRHLSIPPALDTIARIIREPLRATQKIWKEIGDKFPARRDGRLVNPRMEVERRQANRVLRARRKGARSANAHRDGQRPVSARSPGVQLQSQIHTQKDFKDSWTRVLGSRWTERYGGKAPYGRIGKALLSLKDDPDLERRWVAYLQATDAKYASPQRFAETFGSWGNGKQAPQTYTYEPGVAGPDL